MGVDPDKVHRIVGIPHDSDLRDGNHGRTLVECPRGRTPRIVDDRGIDKDRDRRIIERLEDCTYDYRDYIVPSRKLPAWRIGVKMLGNEKLGRVALVLGRILQDRDDCSSVGHRIPDSNR